MGLVRGGEYETVDMQVGAVATGDGATATPFSVTRGSYNLLTAQVTGITSATITWEGTIDETNWAAIPAYRLSNQTIASTTTANGLYRLAVTGLRGVRARISTWASGTIYVKGILSSTGELGANASGGGSGVTDHDLLNNLDFASAGHTGFEAEGAATAAISTHVGLSDPHTQYALESALGTMATATETNYLLASGTRTGASSQAQTFTGGTVQNKISVPSNTTNAFGLYRSNGTTQDFRYDASTGSILVGDGTVAPDYLIHIQRLTSTAVGFKIVSNYGGARGDGFFANFGLYGSVLSHNREPSSGTFLNEAVSPNQYKAAALIVGGFANGYAFGVATYPGGTPTTRLAVSFDGYVGIGQSSSLTALLDLAASTTARASLRIREGARPTTPNTGDAWNDGAIGSYQINATTNAVVNSLKLERASSGTPAAGFGLGIAARLESSTTEDQDAGRLTYEWVTATHASRASRGKLSAYYTSTEQNAMTWDGDTGGLKLAFYGGTPVAKAAAYTQTYSTADKTLGAYTADNESGAYTGIDNLQVGSVYATVADLNALRTAYENLRAFVEDLAQQHNSLLDDMQALNLVG